MSGVKGVLVQSEASALHALLTVLAAASQTSRQLREMRGVEENALLQALRTDLRRWPEGGVKALQGELDPQSCRLVLDVYNLLSLELIQHPEHLSQEPPVLESTFLGRKQLCIDIQVTSLLSHESLSSLLSTYQIESLPSEFPLALLWDQAPVSSSICTVLLMLTGLQSYADRELRVVSMTLSKGTLALSMVVGKDGQVRVRGEAGEVQMRVEEFIRFAAQWEVKPDMVFLASEGEVALPGLSPTTRAVLEAAIQESETVELKAPVPSIVLQERACVLCGLDFEGGAPVCMCGESWKCEFCDSYNSAQDQICGACAKAKGELSSDSVQVTWRCSRCGNSDNRESDLTCTQCQATKAGLSQPQTEDKWNCRDCGKPNFAWSIRCLACFSSKDGPLGPEVWICGSCQTENPQHRAYCRSCYSARTEPTEAGSEQQWKCGSCGRANRSGSDSCLVCRVKRLGEWKCEKCGEGNVQLAKFCEHCFASKLVPRKASGTCLTCGASSVDPECSKCKAQKARSSSKEATSSRLWSCSACGALNFQSDSNCYRCKQAKAGLDVEWTCQLCSHPNKEEAETCSLCLRPKEKGKACGRCGKKILGDSLLCVLCSSKEAWKCPKCGLTGNSKECRFCEFDKAPRCGTCGKLVLAGQDTCVLCRTKPGTWKCSCGHSNAGYFCQGCRKMKPVSR